MSTTETALTVHLVMPGGHPGNHFLASTQRELKEHFGIGHATVQIEVGAPHDHSHEDECPLDGHAHGRKEHDHKGHNHGEHHHHEKASPNRP